MAVQAIIFASWQLDKALTFFNNDQGVTPELVHACRCLLSVVGGGQWVGYAGEFMTLMSKLALKCDEINVRKLAAVWPEPAMAAWLYHNVSDKIVETIAAGELGGADVHLGS